MQLGVMGTLGDGLAGVQRRDLGAAVLLVRLVGLGVLLVAVVVLVVVATLVLGEAQVDHRLAQRACH